MDNSQRGSLLPIAVALVGITAIAFVCLPILLAGAASSDVVAAAVSNEAACVTSGPIAGLSEIAAQNARTVAAVAAARGGQPAEVLVLMIGLAESGLRQLANVADTTSLTLSIEGVGHDHDSVGIFQQRPSWGTAAQRMDPVSSTNLLLDRVLALPEWQTRPPWLVAQTVQTSAYDGIPRLENHFSRVTGGNYKTQLATATRISNVINADSAALSCDGTGGSPLGAMPSGPVGPYGLPTAYVVPPATSEAGRTAVLAALSVLGRPYVFGATGPNEFDCSGLTQWAWSKAGVNLPHYTGDQWQAGTPTSPQLLMPGDLVLTPGSDGTLANPQHVGMYLGDGLVVEAPQTGDVVKVVTYASFVSAGASGLRHIG